MSWRAIDDNARSGKAILIWTPARNKNIAGYIEHVVWIEEDLDMRPGWESQITGDMIYDSDTQPTHYCEIEAPK